MKGFVPTPAKTVDLMVDLLFREAPPAPGSTVLDPGCGQGAFIEGIMRWCQRHGVRAPEVTGIENDPRHLSVLSAKFASTPNVHILGADFLTSKGAKYDFVVGNPPYVPITELSEGEKTSYRQRYATARGRFDLYLLFFEQALRQLKPNGRLVFITPEKYLYVDSAAPLRKLLSERHVERILMMPEDTFGHLVTYPTVTVVNGAAPGKTEICRRDGSTLAAELPSDAASWLPVVTGASGASGGHTLADLCLRISCGVATGADGIFVRPITALAPGLRRFARPTIAGRELKPSVSHLRPRFCMLMPYDDHGHLLPVDQLAALKDYLFRPGIRSRLLARTCARRKPWYAFHETPDLPRILRPKILCKDIGERPHFWVDREGMLVPRHSVYYIVPKAPESLDAIVEHLRSRAAQQWLSHHCQRAASGFVRLQSNVLKRLPIPERLMPGVPCRPAEEPSLVGAGLAAQG